MGMCASASYLLVVIAALMLPETRGRDLSTVSEDGQEAEAVAGTRGAANQRETAQGRV